MTSVPLTKEEIKNTDGPTVYLIHFERPFRHSRHYLGFTNNLLARIAKHRAGQGARLMEVIGWYGIEFDVVRTWRGDRKLERRLKNWHAGPRLCPICQARRRAQRQQLRMF